MEEKIINNIERISFEELDDLALHTFVTALPAVSAPQRAQQKFSGWIKMAFPMYWELSILQTAGNAQGLIEDRLVRGCRPDLLLRPGIFLHCCQIKESPGADNF